MVAAQDHRRDLVVDACHAGRFAGTAEAPQRAATSVAGAVGFYVVPTIKSCHKFSGSRLRRHERAGLPITKVAAVAGLADVRREGGA